MVSCDWNERITKAQGDSFSKMMEPMVNYQGQSISSLFTNDRFPALTSLKLTDVIKEIVICHGIPMIWKRAFVCCGNLTSAVIQAGYIDQNLYFCILQEFNHCRDPRFSFNHQQQCIPILHQLVSINILNRVASISDRVFSDCASQTSFDNPSQLLWLEQSFLCAQTKLSNHPRQRCIHWSICILELHYIGLDIVP